MAAAVRYLLNRNGRYFARLVVPKQLRPWLDGKTELRQPLGADRRSALKQLASAVAALQDKIARAELRAADVGHSNLKPILRPLSPTQLAVKHYQISLADDEYFRQDWRYSSIGFIDEVFVQKLREGIAGKLSDSDLVQTVGHFIAKYTRLGHITADHGTGAWRDAARALCAAEYESLSRTAERDEGDYTGKPGHPLLSDLSEPEHVEPVDLNRLWNDYVSSRQRIGSMKDGGRRQGLAIRSLIKFVGHQDAARFTRKDLLGWRDHLLGNVSAQTITKVYLPTIRSVFRWAVENDRLPENPSEGVKQTAPKTIWKRERGYTDAEAQKQVSESRQYSPIAGPSGLPLEHPKTTAMKRWVPLLCAYTGARITEVTQIRREDLREENGVHILRITPDAGSVKTNEFRDIPLHTQLIELGFWDYAETISGGPIFHLSKDPAKNHQHAKKMADRLRDWLHEKELVPAGLQPCHGWRHRFKTVGIELGIAERVIDCLQGHASKTAGERYGDITMKAKLNAIERFPKFRFD